MDYAADKLTSDDIEVNDRNKTITGFGLVRFYKSYFKDIFGKNPSDAIDRPAKINVLSIKLVKVLGGDEAKSMVKFVIDNWSMLKKELSLYGMPQIGFIYKYRDALLDIMENGVRVEKQHGINGYRKTEEFGSSL